VGRPSRSRPLSAPLVPDGLDASLVLLRHGQTDFIVDDRFQGQLEAQLTPLGRAQAARAGARLARPHAVPSLPLPPTPPVAIAHSPLHRTTETAEAVATAVGDAWPEAGLRVRPEAGLSEIGQGEWEGLRTADIVARYGDVLGAWRRRPTEVWAPGGESLADVERRVGPAVASLLAELAEGRPRGTLDRSQVAGYRGTDLADDRPWAVLVGHAGVFRVLLLTLFDLPLERFWAFDLALCGITVVELRAGRPTLVAHNLTEHLAGLGDEDAAEAAAAARSRSGAL